MDYSSIGATNQPTMSPAKVEKLVGNQEPAQPSDVRVRALNAETNVTNTYTSTPTGNNEEDDGTTDAQREGSDHKKE